MPWLEINIYSDANFANHLSDYLFEMGADAVTFKDGGDEPIFEPSIEFSQTLWQKTHVVGLFKHDHSLQSILLSLQQSQQEKLIERFEIKHLADQDWERSCLQGFQPIQFGKRLWICPSWFTPPDPKAINIILDPGLAFGTGTHATTALCLQWLEQNLKPGQTVIDYGCGSGILAISAKKLGASQVWAIDHDPQALIATEMNQKRNHIDSKDFFIQTTANNIPEVDIIIANILAKPLIDLAPNLALLVKKSGKIGLSGVLSDQVISVTDAYIPWFMVNKPILRENWALIEGKKGIFV